MEFIYFCLAGAFGSIVKDIVIDGKLILPKKVDGSLVLGFIGSMFIGAFIGWVVDGSLFTAAMGGFVGISLIENLVKRDGKSNTT